VMEVPMGKSVEFVEREKERAHSDLYRKSVAEEC